MLGHTPIAGAPLASSSSGLFSPAVGEAAAGAAVQGIGRQRSAGAGQADGLTVVDGVGTARLRLVGTSVAEATVVGVARTRYQSVGDVTAGATVEGVIQAIASAVGVAEGSSTANAYQREGVGQGDAAGSATAMATIVGRFPSSAQSAGAATAAALGYVRAPAVGQTQGAGSADGDGRTRFQGDGQAEGLSSADGFAQSRGQMVGSAAGVSSADAFAQARVRATGLAEGFSLADGFGQTKVQAAGSSNGISLAQGIPIVDIPSEGLKIGGVCFPSYGREATWTAIGSWDPELPITNLSLLDEPRRIAAQVTAGVSEIRFSLPQSRLIDFLALVDHNAAAAAIFSVDLSSGTDPTQNIVWSLPEVALWGTSRPGTIFTATRPVLLDEPVMVRSGRIRLLQNSGPWEIGGVEIGRFWRWPDIGVDRGIGIDSRAEVQGGQVMRQWAPRVATGRRQVVDQVELDTTLLDFHRARGRSQAFVWCWDVLDPATWVREAWLAKNRNLPRGVVSDYEAGELTYDFEEFLG